MVGSDILGHGGYATKELFAVIGLLAVLMVLGAFVQEVVLLGHDPVTVDWSDVACRWARWLAGGG